MCGLSEFSVNLGYCGHFRQREGKKRVGSAAEMILLKANFYISTGEWIWCSHTSPIWKGKVHFPFWNECWFLKVSNVSGKSIFNFQRNASELIISSALLNLWSTRYKIKELLIKSKSFTTALPKVLHQGEFVVGFMSHFLWRTGWELQISSSQVTEKQKEKLCDFWIATIKNCHHFRGWNMERHIRPPRKQRSFWFWFGCKQRWCSDYFWMWSLKKFYFPLKERFFKNLASCKTACMNKNRVMYSKIMGNNYYLLTGQLVEGALPRAEIPLKSSEGFSLDKEINGTHWTCKSIFVLLYISANESFALLTPDRLTLVKAGQSLLPLLLNTDNPSELSLPETWRLWWGRG